MKVQVTSAISALNAVLQQLKQSLYNFELDGEVPRYIKSLPSYLNAFTDKVIGNKNFSLQEWPAIVNAAYLKLDTILNYTKATLSDVSTGALPNASKATMDLIANVSGQYANDTITAYSYDLNNVTTFTTKPSGVGGQQFNLTIFSAKLNATSWNHSGFQIMKGLESHINNAVADIRSGGQGSTTFGPMLKALQGLSTQLATNIKEQNRTVQAGQAGMDLFLSQLAGNLGMNTSEFIATMMLLADKLNSANSDLSAQLSNGNTNTNVSDLAKDATGRIGEATNPLITTAGQSNQEIQLISTDLKSHLASSTAAVTSQSSMGRNQLSSDFQFNVGGFGNSLVTLNSQQSSISTNAGAASQSSVGTNQLQHSLYSQTSTASADAATAAASAGTQVGDQISEVYKALDKSLLDPIMVRRAIDGELGSQQSTQASFTSDISGAMAGRKRLVDEYVSSSSGYTQRATSRIVGFDKEANTLSGRLQQQVDQASNMANEIAKAFRNDTANLVTAATTDTQTAVSDMATLFRSAYNAISSKLQQRNQNIQGVTNQFMTGYGNEHVSTNKLQLPLPFKCLSCIGWSNDAKANTVTQ